MTALELQTSFEIEAGVIDSNIKPSTTDIFYWINRAIEQFVKTRYSGTNIKREGFEQSQKRIDDLRTLVKEVTITTSTGTIKPNSYIATLPGDYLFTIGEECDIQYTDGFSNTITTRSGISETTIDRYSRDIDNPLSDSILYNDKALPLRLFYENTVELVSDGTYTIPTYYIRYLKQPVTVALPSTTSDLPSHTHIEIIKTAVQMYLENISNNRIKTYSDMTNIME